MVATARKVEALHYPESDEVGEHELQRFIVTLLLPLVQRWLREQGRVAHAGADQFFYLVEGALAQRRAPDLYVVDGVAQDVPDVGTWKLWEGHRPHFALEVCGDDWQKDYDEAPADYARLGTRELVIFDAGATARSRRRVPWQVFRAKRGRGLARVLTSSEDRVQSAELGCWLRRVEDLGRDRLRLATGEKGETLLPTDAELAATAREATAQLALAREAAALAAAREAAAQAELARVRAELDALKRQR